MILGVTVDLSLSWLSMKNQTSQTAIKCTGLENMAVGIMSYLLTRVSNVRGKCL
jgi:hypothetical protein